MDYVKPADVASAMLNAALAKLALPAGALILRGMLSGAILGVATTLAVSASASSGEPIVGAVLFPVGFVAIVLLGLELVTGSFAIVPLAMIEGRASFSQVAGNCALVLIGNLLGALIYAALIALVYTEAWTAAPSVLGVKIAAIADAKTLGYAAHGAAGFATCFVKAVLCNWMVCLGVVLAMTSASTIGKVVTAWLPILVFFAQGFEHLVVNFFVIPAGMMMGAKTSVYIWLVWNGLPVLLGNIVGGFVFTGLAIYLSWRPKSAAPLAAATPSGALAAE